MAPSRIQRAAAEPIASFAPFRYRQEWDELEGPPFQGVVRAGTSASRSRRTTTPTERSGPQERARGACDERRGELDPRRPTTDPRTISAGPNHRCGLGARARAADGDPGGVRAAAAPGAAAWGRAARDARGRAAQQRDRGRDGGGEPAALSGAGRVLWAGAGAAPQVLGVLLAEGGRGARSGRGRDARAHRGARRAHRRASGAGPGVRMGIADAVGSGALSAQPVHGDLQLADAAFRMSVSGRRTFGPWS
jgi:hypothetical protein